MNHDYEWDIYRNPKNKNLYKKRYVCCICGKVKYSRSLNSYVSMGEKGRTEMKDIKLRRSVEIWTNSKKEG